MLKTILQLASLLILCVTHSTADVKDHLITLPNKSSGHQMRNIDFIYLINLDHRHEKYAASLEKFAQYEIKPFRFSAINGWKLPIEVLNDIGLKYQPWMSGENWATTFSPDEGGQAHHELLTAVGRTYFSYDLTRGAIGHILSHLSVLQDAYDSGYETIWVLEDDFHILRNPHVISDLIVKLDFLVGKRGWDILFTDRDFRNSLDGEYIPCKAYAWRPDFGPSDPKRFSFNKSISSDFRQVGARYGTYSMVIRRSGVKKILDFFNKHQLFLPYDLEISLPDDIRFFTVQEDVVSKIQRSESDKKKNTSN